MANDGGCNLALAQQDRESEISGANVTPAIMLTREVLEDLGLPETYLTKTCSLCGNHSASPNPFPGHSDTKAWGKCLPWSSGTVRQPRGELCRVCVYVYHHAGFSTLFPRLRDYIKHVRLNPEEHTEFRDTRNKYIQMKLADPKLVLRDSKDLWPARIITLVKTRESKMHKPQTWFMELSQFEAKHGKAKPELIITRTFQGQSMKGVIVTKQEDQGMWRLEETEPNSVTITAQTADTQLREAQTDEAYASFGKRLDDANNTETSLVLASAVASSAGGSGSSSSSGGGGVIIDQVLLTLQDNDDDDEGNSGTAPAAEGDDDGSGDEDVMNSAGDAALMRGFGFAPATATLAETPPPGGKRAAKASGQPRDQSCSQQPGSKRQKLAAATPTLPAPVAPAPSPVPAPVQDSVGALAMPPPSAPPPKKARISANSGNPSQAPKAKARGTPKAKAKSGAVASVTADAPSAADDKAAVTAKIIGCADLALIPADGGVSKLEPLKAEKAGQGRRTGEEMDREDAHFVATRMGELKDLTNLAAIPGDDEPEMLSFAKNKVRDASTLCSKISSKQTAMKRRKSSSGTDGSATTDEDLAKINATALAFQEFYRELAQEAPLGIQLNMTMNVLIHAGYTFSRSVHLKQVKALVMDELRFGNFDQITHHFQTGSTSMQLLGKVDEAVGQNDGGCGTASMLVCQLLQRLFKAVPETKNVLATTSMRNLAHAVGVFANGENLALDDSLVNQFQVLFHALAAVDLLGSDKQDSPRLVILPQDSLKAVQEIEAISQSESASDASKALLASFASLSQCRHALEELKSVYTKKSIQSKELAELGDLKKEIGNASEAASDPSAENWKNIFGKLEELEVRINTKGKPEAAALLPSLKLQWGQVAIRILTRHVEEDIVPFLHILGADLGNGVPLHSLPENWCFSLALRDACAPAQRVGVSGDHVAFQCHDFFKSLRSWHESLLQSHDQDANEPRPQSMSTVAVMDLLDKWCTLEGHIKPLLRQEGLSTKLDGFTAALKTIIMDTLLHSSRLIQDKLAQQVKDILAAEKHNPDDFLDVSCQSMQRLGKALLGKDKDLGDRLFRMGEGMQHFLILAGASILFIDNRSALQMSSKPDKITKATLQAVATANSTALGYFRKIKTLEFASLVLEHESTECQEHLADTLNEMVSSADGVWQTQIKDWMVNILACSSEGLTKTLDKLPVYHADSFQAYKKVIEDGKVASVASSLKKRVDAASCCAKIADCPTEFIAEFDALAIRGLSAVATVSVALLLQSSLWAGDNMNKKFLQDTTNKDSDEAKLCSSLKVNQDFVKKQGLSLPECLAEEMVKRLHSLAQESEPVALASK